MLFGFIFLKSKLIQNCLFVVINKIYIELFYILIDMYNYGLIEKDEIFEMRILKFGLI